MATRPLISLCMIVRDEAEHLEACLRCAAPAVDEIIIVDTGSLDATPQIAARLGATILHRPWRDDFSEARNASLDAASGRYTLILDADERLAPDAPAIMRQLIEAEGDADPITVYLPLILNVDAQGAPLGADHMPRFWRSRPEVRFTGRVHERIRVEARQVYVDALRITHLGYDPEWVAKRGKRARNLKLIEAERAAAPEASLWIYYLAKERYAEGRDAEALEGFRAVIADGALPNLALSARVFAVECLRTLGRDAEALEEARRGLEAAPGYSELALVGGLAALSCERYAEAHALLERAARPTEGVAQVAFHDPETQLRARRTRGRLLLAEGRAAEALPLLDHPSAALDAARACLTLNDARGALAALRRLPKDADPRALAEARALLEALKRGLAGR